MSDESLESVSRTEVLNRFRFEYTDEIEEAYRESYGDEMDIALTGPMGTTNRGPSTAVQETDFHEYDAVMGVYDKELPFRVTVHDMPYSVDEIFDSNTLDLSKFAEAFKTEFDPEASRTRFIQLSLDGPEKDGEEMKDQWFALRQAVNDALEPEDDFSTNPMEHIYVYELKDTKIS